MVNKFYAVFEKQFYFSHCLGIDSVFCEDSSNTIYRKTNIYCTHCMKQTEYPKAAVSLESPVSAQARLQDNKNEALNNTATHFYNILCYCMYTFD